MGSEGVYSYRLVSPFDSYRYYMTQAALSISVQGSSPISALPTQFIHHALLMVTIDPMVYM